MFFFNYWNDTTLVTTNTQPNIILIINQLSVMVYYNIPADYKKNNISMVNGSNIIFTFSHRVMV